MAFDPTEYGPAVTEILGHGANGHRPFALTSPRSGPGAVATLLDAPLTLSACAKAGLYLYFGFWEQAHHLVDDLSTPDGTYWHGIVHRLEPDAGNAGYWFRQTGRHAIHGDLHLEAKEIGYPSGGAWDANAFTDACEQARSGEAAQLMHLLERVQLAEWQLLFAHSMRTGA